MIPNGDYPLGADLDSKAPWKEVENPRVDFPCTIEQVMTKMTEIATSEYTITKGEEKCAEYELGEINLQEEYQEQHYTIPELLCELEMYVKRDLSFSCNGLDAKHLRNLLKEIEGWKCVETTVKEGYL